MGTNMSRKKSENRKCIWLVFAVIVLATAILVSFWVTSILPPPPDFPAPNVAPVGPHYLPFVQVSWRDANETKVFLEAANPRYGYYKNVTNGGAFPKGVPCFIVSVTVRNDYTNNDPPPTNHLDYNFSRYGYYIYFVASVYNKDGTVDAKGLAISQQSGWFGNIYPINFIRINSGETRTFDVYIATEKRNTERFEILVFDIGPQIVQ